MRDDLGTRMKTYYENIPKTKLMRRTPVMIRIDGKSFHTFTKGFQKPFDSVLIKTMQETTKYLCENIQGCVFGYTQSDEITLILIDYKELNSSAWYDYEVQKMCSISASMATMAFNKFFHKNASEIIIDYNSSLIPQSIALQQKANKYHSVLIKAVKKGAMFDSRCFNVPKEEVTNFVYWRQLDAIRNSIQMVGQANYSQKELNKKSCKKIKEMLLTEKGIDWDGFPIVKRRGSACIKDENGNWFIDENMPILKKTEEYNGRDYIEKLIVF